MRSNFFFYSHLRTLFCIVFRGRNIYWLPGLGIKPKPRYVLWPKGNKLKFFGYETTLDQLIHTGHGRSNVSNSNVMWIRISCTYTASEMPITPESLPWIICMGFNVLSMFSKTLWYGYSCLQRGNSCFVLFVSFFKFINILLYFSK